MVRIVFSALVSTVIAPIGALVEGILYYRPLSFAQAAPASDPVDGPPPTA